jgi:hypothetical protein
VAREGRVPAGVRLDGDQREERRQDRHGHRDARHADDRPSRGLRGQHRHQVEDARPSAH